MENLGIGRQQNRAVKPPPNLDLINASRSQRLGKIIVRGIKCKCGKSWCSVCSVKTVIKRFYEYVHGWDWQRVRELVLTVDRNKFESPEQAYTYLSKKKKIAGMIRNLERTQGIVVADWCWLLEWHKDGFPHWHVFVLVDKEGRRGQIGYKKILQYWDYGKIDEGYIHSQSHWEYLTGYFKKHGYFNKKKAHQARLPEWARNRKEVIRRFSRKGSKRSKMSEDLGGDASGNEKNESIALNQLCNWFEKKALEDLRKTEGQKLDNCGSETDIYLGPFGYQYFCRLNIPYHEFKKMGGEYAEGLGHVIEMNRVEFELFRAKHEVCNNLSYQ